MKLRWANMDREQLLAAVEFYYDACCRMEYEITELVAPALGYENDPVYGWVTGDHVAQSLVDELVTKFKELTR